jgi:3-phenylpropionate/trans-cinnamate dioxygenase ferredoxin subunit
MSGKVRTAVENRAPAPRYAVCRVSELENGQRRVAEIAGRSIGVFNVDGQFYAIRNRCPHQGGPLCQGRLLAALDSDGPGRYRYDEGRHLVECPWHGWEFDLATGQSWFDPARTRVRRYSVTVERVPRPETDGLTPGPHRVDSYPVSVEEECVIVEFPGLR